MNERTKARGELDLWLLIIFFRFLFIAKEFFYGKYKFLVIDRLKTISR